MHTMQLGVDIEELGEDKAAEGDGDHVDEVGVRIHVDAKDKDDRALVERFKAPPKECLHVQVTALLQ